MISLLNGEIIQGDCLKVMRGLPKVDMILADLPYQKTNCDWDIPIDLDYMWAQYYNLIKPNGAICLFAQQPFSSRLIEKSKVPFKYELVWDKGKGSNPLLAKKRPMISHENILVFYKKQPTYNPQMRKGKPYKAPRTGGIHTSRTMGINRPQGYFKQKDSIKGELYPLSVLSYSMHCGSKLHPTQKPVDLCRWLIRTYTNAGDTVLDNCCGVGTTLIAAVKEHRRFIGIELSKKFYKQSIESLEKLQK